MGSIGHFTVRSQEHEKYLGSSKDCTKLIVSDCQRTGSFAIHHTVASLLSLLSMVVDYRAMGMAMHTPQTPRMAGRLLS